MGRDDPSHGFAPKLFCDLTQSWSDVGGREAALDEERAARGARRGGRQVVVVRSGG